MYLDDRMLVEAALLILVVIGVAYITTTYYTKKPTYQGDKEYYSLNDTQPIKVLSHEDAPWLAGPCSVRFLLFLEHAPRTLQKVDCLPTSTTEATVFKPACSDNSFGRCKCTTTDCKDCNDSANQGFMYNLLKKDTLVQLWLSGYTSDNDKSKSDALLKIKTAKSVNAYYMEAVELPAIPMQKWVMVTIVKEGRRIDVYYGEKLAASKLLDYIPVSSESKLVWTAGNPNWRGKIGYFVGVQKAQSSEDIQKDVQSILNTRGEPLDYDPLKPGMSLSLPDCWLGNCNTFPQVKPLNPFAVYVSSVA
jgi:hypothetical protein